MKDCQDLQEVAGRESGRFGLLEYRLSDRLTLAGQPQPADWPSIARRGFTLVINMRSDEGRAAEQAANMADSNLHQVHLPLPAYELDPIHLAMFHQLLEQSEAERIYLHCRSASRTALLWMLHRVTYDGLTQKEAEAELQAAGYDDESVEALAFCAEDFFERSFTTELLLS